MAYSVDNKLVIAVSSSVLFDLRESDTIFRTEGQEAYRRFQQAHQQQPLSPGVAFPFVRRLLSLNQAFPEETPIEVILFSKNSPETGLRVFHSIKHHGLAITRACFSSGRPNYHYLPAFNSCLFLSSNRNDVQEAVDSGHAAGLVDTQLVQDHDDDPELRLAFDFDGVIGDDSAERVYQTQGLSDFLAHEDTHGQRPLQPGPISALLQRISSFQRLERAKQAQDPSYRRLLRTAIVTARNAPAHLRVVTTLQQRNIEVDEVFFMGGVSKKGVLDILKPHIFFDDQVKHLQDLQNVAGVHIPFGIANQKQTD